MASGEYTFYPKFSEFVTLYRGVIRVWIADGTQLNPGTNGKLYAEYVDGAVQELGYVSDYETARQYFAELGISLTYPEWVSLLAHTPENAKRSESWAVGKVDGQPVPQEDETYNNNSRYYAEQSKIWVDGKDFDETPVQPQNNATFWTEESHGWTNNKEGSVHGYSDTNNAKYWAEQSKEYTNGKDLDGTDVPARQTDNAVYFKDQAKLWANNGVQGETPNAINNSRYWAEQSKSYSDGKSLDDQTTIRGTDNAEYYKEEARKWVGSTGEHATDTDNAVYWKDQAKLWANNGIQGDTPSADNNARHWAEQAKSYSDGKDLSDLSDIRPTDNAEYYKDQSKLWANNGEQGEVPGADNNAKYWAEQAKTYSDGKDFSETDVRPTDNAEYYKDQSKLWANNGIQGDTPGAENNSRYWAEQAKSYSDGKSLDDQTTIRETDNAEYYKEEARMWAGSDNEHATATDNAKHWNDTAHLWTNFGDDEGSPSAENNAKAYSLNSEESKLQSESWAKGTRNGEPDTERQNAAIDNSKFYSEESMRWANFGTDGSTPTAQNNAKEYAHQSSLSATAAGESEDRADQHMRDAQAAQSAAETAQQKAEEATGHYPRIKSNDNWEVWNVQNEEWQDTGRKSMATAEIEYAYQNSSSGTNPPTGEWTDTPQPQVAKFLWIRMKYTWTNGRVDYFYNVSYIGANGTGSVNSVNGIGGDVILDGSNIYVDNNVQDKETMYQAFTRIGVAITNSEIDALFNVG